MMRVSSMLAVWALAMGLAGTGCDAAATAPSEPAAGRPAGASEGLRAAVVVAVNGRATITPSQGTPFAADPDQELLADDTITTEADGFIMLELHNGHVIRVRSGDGLRVDRTAAFAEPAAAGELADRLAAALSPDESRDPRLQVAARVAGWNMRMSSAQTFGVQPVSAPVAIEESKSRGNEGQLERDDEPVAESPPPLQPASDPISEAKKSDQLGSAKDKSSGKHGHLENTRLPGGGGEPEPQPAPKPPPRPDTKSEPSKPPKDPGPPESEDPSAGDPGGAPVPLPKDLALDLPDSVDFVAEGGAKRRVGLPGPLIAERKALATCAGAGAKIRAQVKAGKLSKLEVGGAASKCVPALVGKTVALEDGWLELRVKS